MEEGLRWFLRRTNDPEIINHIEELVEEGFDYEDVCDYIGMKKEYVREIVRGSTITFINSYDGLDKLNESSVLRIYNFIMSRFLEVITEHYDSNIEDCDGFL